VQWHTLHNPAVLHGKLNPLSGDMDLNFWREANTVKKLTELSNRSRYCAEYWAGILCLCQGRHGEFSYHRKSRRSQKRYLDSLNHTLPTDLLFYRLSSRGGHAIIHRRWIGRIVTSMTLSPSFHFASKLINSWARRITVVFVSQVYPLHFIPANLNNERNLYVDPNGADHIHCTEANGEGSRDTNQWQVDDRSI
jgi:hypothetical protein